MATDYTAITDPAELLDALTRLVAEQHERAELIKCLTIQAVRLGAYRYEVATAASISRPTLNAWLNEKEQS